MSSSRLKSVAILLWAWVGLGVAIAEHFPSGSVDDRPVTSLDIAATALDLAGLPIDEKADGVSVLGWLHKPGTATPHENNFLTDEWGQDGFLQRQLEDCPTKAERFH